VSHSYTAHRPLSHLARAPGSSGAVGRPPCSQSTRGPRRPQARANILARLQFKLDQLQLTSARRSMAGPLTCPSVCRLIRARRRPPRCARSSAAPRHSRRCRQSAGYGTIHYWASHLAPHICACNPTTPSRNFKAQNTYY
jgi:hypothetical protein